MILKYPLYVFTRCLPTMLLSLSISIGSGYAQQTSIDLDRMRRDLDIMETILQKLVAPSASLWLDHDGRAQSIYFEDYGVVLSVKYPGLARLMTRDFLFSISESAAISVISETSEENDKNKVVINTRGRSPSNLRTRMRKDENGQNRVSIVRERMVQFLGSYADAIGQLNPSDKITVLTDFSSTRPWGLIFGDGDRADLISMLEASVSKKDIIEYRRGRLTPAAFRAKIEFKEHADDKQNDKSLDILSKIIDTSLSRKYAEHRSFVSGGKNRAVYLKGLGALFFVGVEPGIRAAFLSVDELKISDGSTVVLRSMEKNREERDEQILELKAELIRVIRDYGHTLRTIGANEYVICSVRLDNLIELEEAISQVMLKVKKSNIDAFNRHEINAIEFKKRVEFRQM